MFNFKKIIIYSLSMIIPYIFGSSSLESNIFDFTTINNQYKYPLVTSWSKDQLVCASCGYFALSRVLEYYGTLVSILNKDKIKNYDISIDWLIDIGLTSLEQTTVDCGDTCSLTPALFKQIINALYTVCQEDYDANSTEFCVIESEWCPYSYDAYAGVVDINKLCRDYHSNNVIKINSSPKTKDNIVFEQAYSGVYTVYRQFEQFGTGFVGYVSLYLQATCYGYIIDAYKENPLTLLTNDIQACKLNDPSDYAQSNHAVAFVGMGKWPVDGDYKDKLYAKLLNSWGINVGDNNFIYVLLEDIPGQITSTSYKGPLNIYDVFITLTPPPTPQ